MKYEFLGIIFNQKSIAGHIGEGDKCTVYKSPVGPITRYKKKDIT